jgi:cytochrome c biogenesis protein CcmG, thiol:disulfide interchange protein DsbE
VRISVAVAFIVVLATGCEPSSSVSPGPSATNAATASLLPGSVSTLPSFDFATYERLIYELRGTPVVVNLWASWCGPCGKEAPALAAAADRFGAKVQFLGVAIKDQRSSASAFLKRYGIPYPTVMDDSGDIHNHLGFVGLPDTVFYAADGSIARTWSGPLTSETLDASIGRLISWSDTSPTNA